MTKWTLPEGRKPLTDADMAALTHRLADTAIEQSELYQAAKRDAEEAEAYAAELEAKLAQQDDLVAAERERCARVAETEGVMPWTNANQPEGSWYKHGRRIAAAIRKREGESDD